MSKLLRIDSSSRIENSHSRNLADVFQRQWQKVHPDDEVIFRDVVKNPISHISDATINGFYTPGANMSDELKEATRLSDELIAELLSVETLLISSPMYNFSVPSSLKAYIDHIVRINHTFSYDGQKFRGLLKVKRAYLCISFGATGYQDGGPARPFNFLEPYLTGLLSFLGVTQIKTFAIEGTTSSDEVTLKKSADAVEKQIEEIIS